MSADASPCGFVVERNHGQRPRPGSPQFNRRLSQWLSLAEAVVVGMFTGKVERGPGIPTAPQLIAADERMTSGSLSAQGSGGARRHAPAEQGSTRPSVARPLTSRGPGPPCAAALRATSRIPQ